MRGYEFADREIERVAVFLDNDLLIFSFVLPAPSIIIPTQAPVLVWAKICHVALIYTAILQAYPQISMYVDTTVWYNVSALVVTQCAPLPPLLLLNKSQLCQTVILPILNVRTLDNRLVCQE